MSKVEKITILVKKINHNSFILTSLIVEIINLFFSNYYIYLLKKLKIICKWELLIIWKIYIYIYIYIYILF